MNAQLKPVGQAHVKEVLEDLEKTLIAFMRRHAITHDQYRRATQVLVETVKHGEESLLWDVFFEAEATDIGNQGRRGSPEAIEGPFYLPGAPELKAPYVLPMRSDEKGHPLFFHGRVTDANGRGLPGVEIDVWQADADGLYANIHPDIPAWNLRGRFKTDTQGNFEARTILPPPYEIPKNGPTGTVLNAMGRHFFRPAHLHVKVRHPGFDEMTSQIYFQGGQYLENDVANAVRDGLIAPLVHRDGAAELAAKNVTQPCYSVRYDFALTPR
jgi:catechol 1,2-dioxygenase